MKNKLLVVILLAISTFCAKAQYSTVAVFPNLVSSTANIRVVRSWTEKNCVLAYSSTHQLFVFDHTDYLSANSSPSFPARIIDLPLSIDSINDICIVDNYAFFCGADVSGKSIVGYIHLEDFWTGFFVGVYSKAVDSLRYVTKIQAYRDDVGAFHVYACGAATSYPIGYMCSAVLEIRDILNNGTDYSFVKMGVDWPAKHEWVDDIIITGKEIVLVSRNNQSLPIPYLTLRRVKKTMGLQDPNLDYLYYLDQPMEYQGPVVGTPLLNDTFAIVYPHANDTGYTIRVRKIHSGPSGMNNLLSYEYGAEDKGHAFVYDVVEMMGGQMLAVLQPWNNAYDNAIVPLLINNLSSPNTYVTVRCHPHGSHISFDAITNGDLVSAQGTYLNLQDLLLPTTLQNGCNIPVQMKVWPTLDLSVVEQQKSVTVIPGISNPLSPVFQPIQGNTLPSSCEE